MTVLSTIRTSNKSAIEESPDPNLVLLVWLWDGCPYWQDPFHRGPWTYRCAEEPLKLKLIRVNDDVTVYDSTRGN